MFSMVCGSTKIKFDENKLPGRVLKVNSKYLMFATNDAFSNFYQILRVMAILFVTKATNERYFSTLYRLKTHLRSTKVVDAHTFGKGFICNPQNYSLFIQNSNWIFWSNQYYIIISILRFYVLTWLTEVWTPLLDNSNARN